MVKCNIYLKYFGSFPKGIAVRESVNGLTSRSGRLISEKVADLSEVRRGRRGRLILEKSATKGGRLSLPGELIFQRLAQVIGSLFDPRGDVFIEERMRPHWSQAGAIVFVTFRTKDSVPRRLVRQWEMEKRRWLEERGWLAGHAHWSTALESMPEDERRAFQAQFNRTREAYLDTCQGRSLLRRPELAAVIAEALRHFDRKRYRLGDLVIMPNHVHLLAAFADAASMRRQCGSWLRFTAAEINRRMGERGHFWQQEPFDHLVRSSAQ